MIDGARNAKKYRPVVRSTHVDAGPQTMIRSDYDSGLGRVNPNRHHVRQKECIRDPAGS